MFCGGEASIKTLRTERCTKLKSGSLSGALIRTSPSQSAELAVVVSCLQRAVSVALPAIMPCHQPVCLCVAAGEGHKRRHLPGRRGLRQCAAAGEKTQLFIKWTTCSCASSSCTLAGCSASVNTSNRECVVKLSVAFKLSLPGFTMLTKNDVTVLLHDTKASKATTKKCNSLAMHALATHHDEEL